MSIKSSSRKSQNKKYKTNIQDVSESWSSKYPDMSNDLTESIPECSCSDHTGKVYLDQIFEISFSYLFECLFEFNEFYYEFIKTRKFTGYFILIFYYFLI